MKIKTILLHWKIKYAGDKELEGKGCKIIPCKKCNNNFKSYVHMRSYGYVYDDICEACLKLYSN